MKEVRGPKKRSWFLLPVKILGGTVIALVLVEAILQVAGLFVSLGLDRDASGEGGVPILCAGDSHTFGLGVLSPLAYPNRLHRLLNDGRELNEYRVICRGVPGRNSAVLREKLPDYLDALRPALVLILAGYNNSWNSDGAWLWEKDGEGGGFHPGRILDRLKLYKLVKLLMLNLRGREDEGLRITSDGERFYVVEDGEERPIHPGRGSAAGLRTGAELERVTLLDLEACVRICRERIASPVLLTYALTGGHFDAVNAAARTAAKRTGALLIDLADAFGKEGAEGMDRLVLPDGTHLNGAGYALAARVILDRLVEESLVKPPAPQAEGSSRKCPSPGELNLSLEIEESGPGGEPVIVIHGMKGISFQVLLSLTRKKQGPDVATGLGRPIEIEADGLFNLSYTVPSFRGTFTDAPLKLKVPRSILEEYAGRTMYCCLVALDDHAADLAGAFLDATPPVTMKN